MSRRRFLVAAIVFSGAVSGTALLPLSRAWAQRTNNQNELMVRVARSMLPHDGVTDDVYREILDSAMAATAEDNSFAAWLDKAETSLPSDFLSLNDDLQFAAVEAMQKEDFFAAILSAVRARLYDHPATWAVIGYEGPSWQKGGYLVRGAGEIDWLPEDE